jgi:hypothetical protein
MSTPSIGAVDSVTEIIRIVDLGIDKILKICYAFGIVDDMYHQLQELRYKIKFLQKCSETKIKIRCYKNE